MSLSVKSQMSLISLCLKDEPEIVCLALVMQPTSSFGNVPNSGMIFPLVLEISENTFT